MADVWRHTEEQVLEDGTIAKVTIELTGGGPDDLSDEDRAMIRRMVPLAAGMLIDRMAPEEKD